MQSISSYINPNTRGLTSNYKNTAIKDKETYNEAMSQHLLNPVEDLVQVLKTPIKLAKSSSLSRQNNSVNIAEGQRIRVNGGDRKSTRLNSSHIQKSRMPSSA